MHFCTGICKFRIFFYRFTTFRVIAPVSVVILTKYIPAGKAPPSPPEGGGCDGHDHSTENIKNFNFFNNGACPIAAINGQWIIENIEIFDLMGRCVGAYQFPSFGGAGEVNISHLPTGMYFVKITTENGTIMKKIIKK